MVVYCGTCKYLQTYGCTNEYYCSAQKETPRIYDPDSPCSCERYTSITKKEETRNENMIVSPFKTELWFNGDYWKTGDAYVIRPKGKREFMSVLSGISYMSDVRFENGMKITIKEFENGDYEIINHISLEHAASKSIACD